MYDPVRYKQDSIDNWNRRARDYHDGWAGCGRGPFRSTKELADAADIRSGHAVLDVACGTGAVSSEVSKRLGPDGTLAGFDFARGALEIARANNPQGHFAEMDAEHPGLRPGLFDRVVCQYALMFFPEPAGALAQIRGLMKRGGKGRLAVAVHGDAKGVPYFGIMMDAITRHVPGIGQEGAPTVTRLGDPDRLKSVIESAGFVDVSVRRFTFEYDAGTFGQYWSDYSTTTAAAIWPRVEASGFVEKIRADAEQSARPFARENGRLVLPWDVLIATAATK
ncbi:MAG: methyltransferase domain-containing protein [Thermoproteota archaeon]